MKPLSKIRKSAMGQECQVRIPGVCSHDPETTVLAHMNGSGMGMKAIDIHGAYCCSSCHDRIDNRSNSVLSDYNSDHILIMFYEGIFRTQRLLIEQGLLVIK